MRVSALAVFVGVVLLVQAAVSSETEDDRSAATVAAAVATSETNNTLSFKDALRKCVDLGVKQGRTSTQQSAASYAHICIQLALSNKPLVFGLGMDSLVYESMNDRVVFVEDNLDWINKVKAQGLESKVVQYSYETKIKDMSTVPRDEEVPVEKLRSALGDDYDFVFVDAPAGYRTGTPGRFERAKFVSGLKRIGLSCVCVNDYNRAIERHLFERYFGTPDDVLSKFGNR